MTRLRKRVFTCTLDGSAVLLKRGMREWQAIQACILKPKIEYLNTDLDLAARYDLTSLTEALSERGAFLLDPCTEQDDGTWDATLETEESFSSPQPNVDALLDAIETLDSDSRQDWDGCTLREFNIGYDCGDEPWAFNNELNFQTLSRMAALRISLRITIYPYSPPREESGKTDDASDSLDK